MKRDNRYKSIYDTVRLNIRKYRRKKGITQQELADLADLSHGYIRDIESINMGGNLLFRCC